MPIGIYFTLLAIWFVVSIPLTFAGGYFATRLRIRDYPVKTNQIPRHIPPPPLAANPVLLFFAAGILPFGTMFIELYFAMTSLWLGCGGRACGECGACELGRQCLTGAHFMEPPKPLVIALCILL